MHSPTCPDIIKLQCRDRVIRAIRNWFYENGFMEVHTPVLTREVAPEANIDLFRIDMDAFYALVSSPELCMKRLMACGASRIFQLGPVFRKDEKGALHNPEFTLLEWYREHADYTALMDDCEQIVSVAMKAAGHDSETLMWQGETVGFRFPFERFAVEDAFAEHAGWRPGPSPDPERFYHDFAFRVEPSLPADPVFLLDYPASMASLARLKPDNVNVAERVELYIAGIELANGFSELVDAREQRTRFETENMYRKANGPEPYPLPEDFLDAMCNMPPCAGMAMGVDRLLMLLTDSSSIDEVMPFSMF